MPRLWHVRRRGSNRQFYDDAGETLRPELQEQALSMAPIAAVTPLSE